MSEADREKPEKESVAEKVRAELPALPDTLPALVRSKPSKKANYHEYREDLRVDFWFSCAYCTIAESEAQGIGFEIDHYWPREHFKALVNDYDNLMYSCEKCNRLKSSFYTQPTNPERRILRVDQEDPTDHLELKADGETLAERSETGRFNISKLDLNRQALKRLRSLRQDFFKQTRMTQSGLRALLSLKVKSLSASQRLQIARYNRELREEAARRLDTIERLIAEAARSSLLDVDTAHSERMKERRKYLSTVQAIVPRSLDSAKKGIKKSKIKRRAKKKKSR